MGEVLALGPCCRCGGPLHRLAVRNARSRVDNWTPICNDCDNAEAMFNHFFPDRKLPPLNEQIVVSS